MPAINGINPNASFNSSYSAAVITEKNFILSNRRENIIPKVVKIAINDDANNNPFKITSTSSLALLLFFIFFNE